MSNTKTVSAKQCTKCGGPGPFARDKYSHDGLSFRCKPCLAADSKERYRANPVRHKQTQREWAQRNPEKRVAMTRVGALRNREKIMWRSARQRAKKAGLVFTIEASDIVVPERCPLLNVVLDRQATIATRMRAPSLDRKIQELGYTKDNTWVISYRANLLKNNATLEELELLVRNLRSATTGQ